MLGRTQSAGIHGIDSYIVTVEADIATGLPAFDIVGLPDASVRESRERVRAAMKNCGYTVPVSRITVNLAPAEYKKEGAIYDLPILLAILKGSGQLSPSTDGMIFLGELSLSGELRPVRGVLPMVIAAKKAGIASVLVCADNAMEAAVVDGVDVYAAKHLREVVAHLTGEQPLTKAVYCPVEDLPLASAPDMSDVRGQLAPKRALEIAAAGGHNVMMIGPPGSGKSMLARRLPTILSPMSFAESIETAKIHSIAGLLHSSQPLTSVRPFRAPHHTISHVGLAGGGAVPKPGEVSLAHNGVLFLDELPEFSRKAMEVLRQPIEDGLIVISRTKASLTYPCHIMLVAAMNPCPCGFFGHPHKPCTCTPTTVARYLSRVSGPLLDRLDLHVEVAPVDYDDLAGGEQPESSWKVAQRVAAARERQAARYAGSGVALNARLTPRMLREHCTLTQDAQALLQRSFDKLGLSARAHDRILKIARTIADLEGDEALATPHLFEALQYRSLDRKYWNR